MRTLLLSGALTLGAALRPLSAQVSVVDFRIVRSPNGGGISLVASGTAVIGTARTVVALRTDTTGAPIAYQLEGRESGEVRERINAQVGRDRLATRSQTPHGESAREFFLRDGMIILDDAEVHHYYFLTLQRRDTVTVVLPRRNAIAQFRVTAMGDDSVDVAGARVAARRYVVGDDSGERQLWVDAAGRVLRFEAPSLGLVAVRDALPAER